MVSLGVEFEDVSAIDQPTKEMKSLRDIGYPEVPGPNLCLNEYPSLVNGHSRTKYWPWAWASFGGPGGIYLRSLTGITVTYQGYDSLGSLPFTYDTNDIPKQSCKLGSCASEYYGCTKRFAIDGSGGEIIKAVKIRLEDIGGVSSLTFRNPGSLMGLEVTKMPFQGFFY